MISAELRSSADIDINNFAIPSSIFLGTGYVYRTPVRYILNNQQLFGTNNRQGFIDYWNNQAKDGTLPFPDKLILPQGEFTAQALRGYSLTYALGYWELNFTMILYDNTPELGTKHTLTDSQFISLTQDNTQDLLEPVFDNGLLESALEEYMDCLEDIVSCQSPAVPVITNQLQEALEEYEECLEDIVNCPQRNMNP